MPLPLLQPGQAFGFLPAMVGGDGVAGMDGGDEDAEPGEVALAMTEEELFMLPEMAPASRMADAARAAPMMASIKAYSPALAPSSPSQ